MSTVWLRFEKRWLAELLALPEGFTVVAAQEDSGLDPNRDLSMLRVRADIANGRSDAVYINVPSFVNRSLLEQFLAQHIATALGASRRESDRALLAGQRSQPPGPSGPPGLAPTRASDAAEAIPVGIVTNMQTGETTAQPSLAEMFAQASRNLDTLRADPVRTQPTTIAEQADQDRASLDAMRAQYRQMLRGIPIPPPALPQIIDLTPPDLSHELGDFRLLDIPDDLDDAAKPTCEDPFTAEQQPWVELPNYVLDPMTGRRTPVLAEPRIRTIEGVVIHAADVDEMMVELRRDLDRRPASTTRALRVAAALQPGEYADYAQRTGMPGGATVVGIIAEASRRVLAEMEPIYSSEDATEPHEPIHPTLRSAYGLAEGFANPPPGCQWSHSRPDRPRTEFSYYNPRIYERYDRTGLRQARTGIFSVAEVEAAESGVVQHRRTAAGLWESVVVSLLERGSDLPNLELLNRVRITNDAVLGTVQVQCRWCEQTFPWTGEQYCRQCGGSI